MGLHPFEESQGPIGMDPGALIRKGPCGTQAPKAKLWPAWSQRGQLLPRCSLGSKHLWASLSLSSLSCEWNKVQNRGADLGSGARQPGFKPRF